MKSIIQLVTAAIFAAVMGVGCAAAASFVKWNDTEISDNIEEYQSENQPFDGMYFSTEYVVEEYEYDDAFCLLYHDPDGNLFDCEIIVDLKTFKLVHKTIKDNQILVGCLVLNRDCCYDNLNVFTFMPDPECVMANASANFNNKLQNQ